MIRRPLLWVLGAWIFGEIVAFMLGAAPYYHTSLDEYMEGSTYLEVVSEGIIDKVIKGDTGYSYSLSSCVVKIGGAELSCHGLMLYGVEAPAGDGAESKSESKSASESASASASASEVDDALSIGTRVRVTGKIYHFDTADNPGGFNKWLYYRTRGIDYRMSVSDTEVLELAQGGLISNALNSFKQKLEESIESISEDTEEAGLFKALLLGDRSDLADETYESFKNCGIAHILAVSGLHLSLLGEIFLRALKKIGIKKIPASAIADGLLLLYVIMISGSASAWRAYIMFTLSLLAPILRRTYDSLSALAAAGIILLIYQPLYALDGGFQLSFGAIAGIGLMYKPLSRIADEWREKFLKKRWMARCKKQNSCEPFKAPDAGFIYKYIVSALLLSLSIQIFTLPIVAYHYYTISLYGLFLNLLILPLMSIAMISIVLGSFFGMFSFIAGSFFIGAAHYIFKGVIGLCAIVENLPAARIVIGEPSLIQIALFYGVMALILCTLKYLSKSDMRWPCAAAVLLLGFILMPRAPNEFSITNLYIGQGDCAVIRAPTGQTYMVDCGSTSDENAADNTVIPYLLSQGITRINAIFLSHSDSDHINAIETLAAEKLIEIDAIYAPVATIDDEGFAVIRTAAKENNIEFSGISPAGKSVAGKDAEAQDSALQIKMLGPYAGEEFEDINDGSMLLLISYEDFTALFTGDITSDREEELFLSQTISSAFLQSVSGGITYLKCPHHGSKYSSSSDFLEKLSPLITVISVGRNNRYGHPGDETLERLSAANTSIFRTDYMGAVTTSVTKGGEIEVKTFKTNYP